MKSIKGILIASAILAVSLGSCKDKTIYLKQEVPIIECHSISLTEVEATVVNKVSYPFICGFVIGADPNPILETPTNDIIWATASKFNMNILTSNVKEFYIRAFVYVSGKETQVTYSNNVFIKLN